MGRRKAAVDQNKSGVAREGTCSESWNIFTIAALYHKRMLKGNEYTKYWNINKKIAYFIFLQRQKFR